MCRSSRFYCSTFSENKMKYPTSYGMLLLDTGSGIRLPRFSKGKILAIWQRFNKGFSGWGQTEVKVITVDFIVTDTNHSRYYLSVLKVKLMVLKNRAYCAMLKFCHLPKLGGGFWTEIRKVLKWAPLNVGEVRQFHLPPPSLHTLTFKPFLQKSPQIRVQFFFLIV